MEEDLARTKLETNQKKHDLCKLELLLEAPQYKHKKSKSRKGDNQSNVSESASPSLVADKKSKKVKEGEAKPTEQQCRGLSDDNSKSSSSILCLTPFNQ